METSNRMGKIGGTVEGSRMARRGKGLRVIAMLVGLLALVGVLGGAGAPAQAAPLGSSDKTSVAAVSAGGLDKTPVAAVPAVSGTYLQEGFEAGALTGSVFAASQVTITPTPPPSPVPGWTVDASSAHQGAYAAFAPDIAGLTDQRLTMINQIAVPANATSAILSFWHSYVLEGGDWDGGVLETSTDNGATWQDVLSTTTFLSGGYTGQIHASLNPLSGRMGWVGASGGFTPSSINLLPFQGHPLQIRLRLGTDLSNQGGPDGWWVDDVQVTYQAPCDLGGWAAQTPYQIQTAALTVAAQNGVIYSFGGINVLNTDGIVNAYKYDTATHVWSAIADLPAPRYFASAISDGTYIYILGGVVGSNGMVVNTLWRYNPATDSYTTLAPFTVPAGGAGVVYLNGKIYRITGATGASSYSSSVEVYTIATNTWVLTTSYPIENAALMVTVRNGLIYAAGGLSTSGTTTAKTYRFDPATAIWNDAAVPDLPITRYGAVSGVVGNHWVVAGGAASTNITSTIGLNLTTNIWEEMPSLLAGRYLAGGTVTGSALYVIGGLDVLSHRSTDNEEYAEIPCASPSPTPSPTTTPGPGLTPSPSPTTCSLQFSDVPAGSTFYDFVHCLACQGIVGGYACGGPGEPCPGTYFRPTTNVTRSQVSKIVAASASFADPVPSTQQTFEDVPSSNTFWLWIERLSGRGIIGGYPCGGAGEPCVAPGNRPYFRASNNVTRGQLAKIISGAAGYTETPTAQTFADILPGSTFYVYIERVASRSIVGGYPCGGVGEPCGAPTNRPYFRPNANATRGQMSKIAAAAFFPGCATLAGSAPRQ